MNFNHSRRHFVSGLGWTTLATAVAGPTLAAAAPAPERLNPKDPIAVGLGYIEDATRVDTKANPGFIPGSNCASCLQLSGTPGDPYQPCKLFPGKLVAAKGWCKAWTPQI